MWVPNLCMNSLMEVIFYNSSYNKQTKFREASYFVFSKSFCRVETDNVFCSRSEAAAATPAEGSHHACRPNKVSEYSNLKRKARKKTKTQKLSLTCCEISDAFPFSVRAAFRHSHLLRVKPSYASISANTSPRSVLDLYLNPAFLNALAFHLEFLAEIPNVATNLRNLSPAR